MRLPANCRPPAASGHKWHSGPTFLGVSRPLFSGMGGRGTQTSGGTVEEMAGNPRLLVPENPARKTLRVARTAPFVAEDPDIRSHRQFAETPPPKRAHTWRATSPFARPRGQLLSEPTGNHGRFAPACLSGSFTCRPMAADSRAPEHCRCLSGRESIRYHDLGIARRRAGSPSSNPRCSKGGGHVGSGKRRFEAE